MLDSLYRALRVKLKISGGWHREAVGGRWEQIGKLQFEFLLGRGLKPDHCLLDIGCGSLRGGVHFIDYLATGHYFGIEKEASLLQAGREVELPAYDLEHKEPQLFLIDNFDLSPLGPNVQFDFMLAQSVFTHLTPELIELCLAGVLPRLKLGGRFYATFYESRGGAINQGIPHLFRRNERMGTRYPFSLFQTLAERVGAAAEYIGKWNHPRGQRMLAFTRMTS